MNKCHKVDRCISKFRETVHNLEKVAQTGSCTPVFQRRKPGFY